MEIGQTFSPYKKFQGVFIPNAILEYKEISSSAKLVWGKLAQYCGKKNFCWPSQEALAEDIGLSVSYIQKILSELIDHQFIRKNNPQGKDKLSHKTNRYQILWHFVFEEDDSGFRKPLYDVSEDTLYDVSKVNESVLNESCSKSCFINKTNIDFDKSSLSDSNPIEKKKIPRQLKQQIPTPKEKVKHITKDVENLINFWNNLGLVKHREGTKTYIEIASCLNKLINGVFFDKNGIFKKYSDRKFTTQEITETMQRFSLAATNFNYLPINDYKKILKKTGLNHFLHNPFGKQEKSLFLEYFENPPQLLKEEQRLTTDEDPETTKIIKSFWVNKVLGGITPTEWSQKEENSFRRCGKSLTIFWKSNIKKVNTEFGIAGDDLLAKRNRVELLFEAILDDVNEDISKINVGWLCSTMTLNTRLPKYLFAQGIIREN